ncbi:hypothetical protein GQ54DRAFT_94361 [Martensiomyces pterosporus]|nr:hypothetical protein GQ54DRAFT_94361 [Martensiomyces pterosporus]
MLLRLLSPRIKPRSTRQLEAAAQQVLLSNLSFPSLSHLRLPFQLGASYTTLFRVILPHPHRPTSTMKFTATAALCLSAVALAQDSASATTKSAFDLCLDATCPKNRNDPNCQATCKGVPNPNASMIANANECYGKCNSSNLDYQGAIDCHNNCNNLLYNPSGVVVSDHLVPAGVSSGASAAPTSAAASGSGSASPSATTKASSAPTTGASSAPKSSGTGSASASASGSANASTTAAGSTSKNSASTLTKTALSAMVVVAAAALF